MKGFFSRSLPKAKDQTSLHRKVSRLDLFFDLMYVLLLRDLFYVLSGEVTMQIIGQIMIFFIPMWLIWHGYNFYVQRFEETTLRHRLMTFGIMACIGVYSFSIHKFGLQITTRLIYAGACAHLILGYLFISATRLKENDHVAEIAHVVGVSHTLYATLWMIGAYILDITFIFSLIGTSSFVFLGLLFMIPYLFKKRPKLHSGHLGERFGLFIIIVLAELIYGLISGLSDATYFDTQVILVTAGGFLMVIAIRRLYFDVIGHNPMRKTSLRFVTHRSLLHLPLSLSIIYLGGMFLHMIFQVSSDIIQRELMFMTGLLVLVIFFIIGLLSFFHDFERKNYAKRFHLSTYLPGYIMLLQVAIFPILLRVLQISTPDVLIFVLLLLFTSNIIAFHTFFDPLDADESFE